MYTNRKIWNVSYPILLSLLAQNIINVTDTAFLGHVGEVALGASAMGGLFYISVFTIAFGFSTGSQIVIARRNGSQEYTDIGPVMIQGTLFLLTIALLLFGLSWWKSDTLMRALISSDDIYEATQSFLSYRIYGFFFAAINVMFRALYIGITQTKVLTINACIMALVNVILDYLLIFGHGGLPAYGIEGAAIASVIAEGTSVLFFLVYTFVRIDVKRYGLDRFTSFRPDLLKKVLNISSFTMLQYFLSLSTWFLFFIAVERLGQRELAISNIVRSIYMLLLIPIHALATTSNSLVSNVLGSSGRQEVIPLIHKIARLSGGIMLVLSVLFALLASPVLSIYTDQADLISDSISSVYVICIAMIVASVGNIAFNGISGTGNTQVALLIEIGTLVGYVAYVVIVGFGLKASIAVCFGTEILYYACLLIGSYTYLYKSNWEHKKL